MVGAGLLVQRRVHRIPAPHAVCIAEMPAEGDVVGKDRVGKGEQAGRGQGKDDTQVST